MPDDLMPEDLRDFILGHIDSIVQLEALLLLRRKPNEDWDAAKTAKRLYTSEQEVADVLARLCADGLLICSYGHSAGEQLSADRGSACEPNAAHGRPDRR